MVAIANGLWVFGTIEYKHAHEAERLSAVPALLEHRGYPLLASRQHAVLILADLRLHQFLSDQQPALLSELV